MPQSTNGLLFALTTTLACMVTAISGHHTQTTPLEPDVAAVDPAIAPFMPGCVSVLGSSGFTVGLSGVGREFRVVGAGVVVKAKRGERLLILTAHHVDVALGQAGLIHLWNNGHSPIAMRVQVKAVDGAHDLSLLETMAKWSGPDIAIKVAPREPRLGSTLWIVGSPEGIEWNVSRGVLSSVVPCVTPSGDVGVGECYRTDTAVFFGNSGGGVFNGFGQLVGIEDYIETTDMPDADGGIHPTIIPGGGGVVSLGVVKTFLAASAR